MCVELLEVGRDPFTLKVVKGEILNDFLRFISILIAEFAAGDAVNLALKMKGDMMMKGDMIIKNLDLKPTIDAMMRDFLDDEVLKLKNFEKDASLQLLSYQIKKGMSMSVPKSQVSQDGKDYKMAKRDYAWLMIS
ncbi:hypothetical protein Tco_0709774 [Tanacetum coccineum]